MFLSALVQVTGSYPFVWIWTQIKIFNRNFKMQQHLMQMQPMMAAYYPNNVTTDHIQQVPFFFLLLLSLSIPLDTLNCMCSSQTLSVSDSSVKTLFFFFWCSILMRTSPWFSRLLKARTLASSPSVLSKNSWFDLCLSFLHKYTSIKLLSLSVFCRLFLRCWSRIPHKP